MIDTKAAKKQMAKLSACAGKAREACSNCGQRGEDHMEDILTMVEIGSGAQREVEDVRLSRYACCCN